MTTLESSIWQRNYARTFSSLILILTELTPAISCWAAPCCAGRVVELRPGEQLSHCRLHTQCTVEGDAPYWAVTAGRTDVCCPPPTAEGYQEIQELQHLHGRKRQEIIGEIHLSHYSFIVVTSGNQEKMKRNVLPQTDLDVKQ